MYKSWHCAYLTYSVKTWFLTNFSVPEFPEQAWYLCKSRSYSKSVGLLFLSKSNKVRARKADCTVQVVQSSSIPVVAYVNLNGYCVHTNKSYRHRSIRHIRHSHLWSALKIKKTDFSSKLKSHQSIVCLGKNGIVYDAVVHMRSSRQASILAGHS